jgi:uncharacterized protein YggE
MRTIALLSVALLALPARAQSPAPQPPVIVTSAEAHADAPADRATLFVAAETRAASAAQAGQDNARAVRATLDSLKALGLQRDQLGTFGYSVQPVYNQTKLTGYVAHNTIRVEIRKLDDVGRVIDAALAGGANSIGNLQFTATNADSARRDALAHATVQAKGDAETLARAAGGTLGPLMELTANNEGGIRPMYAMRAMVAGAAAPAPTPVEAGPITISVSVQARWQFLPANR